MRIMSLWKRRGMWIGGMLLILCIARGVAQNGSHWRWYRSGNGLYDSRLLSVQSNEARSVVWGKHFMGGAVSSIDGYNVSTNLVLPSNKIDLSILVLYLKFGMKLRGLLGNCSRYI